MTFDSVGVDGAWLLALERHEDDRGFFARAWSASEFRARRLADTMEHCSLSFSHRAGTIRGMHYQVPPREEAKIVRCVRGAIFDVIVDLRPASATFKQWVGRELTADNRLALYVPEGMAHGFQTLSDDTEVFYLISESYEPLLARGVRWNDPAFGIDWPRPVAAMSARDRSFPDFIS